LALINESFHMARIAALAGRVMAAAGASSSQPVENPAATK
jgi:hypothetical protein